MKIPHIIIMALSLSGWCSLPPAHAQRVVPHRIVVKHMGIAASKPQPYALSQAMDQRGHPVGYSMEVDSVVCTDSLCKVVKVTMVWDAVGVYQSYTLADGSVLEK